VDSGVTESKKAVKIDAYWERLIAITRKSTTALLTTLAVSG